MITAIHNSMAAKRDAIKNDEQGFTLIELLVVVLIIGILAAIAIPVFLGQQAAARDSAVRSDISNAKTALVALIVTGAPFPAAGGFTTMGTDFTAAADSNLSLAGTADAFCISGFDTTNTVTSSFAASDITGVAAGTCSAAGLYVP